MLDQELPSLMMNYLFPYVINFWKVFWQTRWERFLGFSPEDAAGERPPITSIKIRCAAEMLLRSTRVSSEFQGVQDRLLVDVFLMGWSQHWICSGISLKKAEKMGFLAWREPLLVRPCNYLKTLHVKLDAEQLSRALPVQKTLISLAWIVLQSRAKNNAMERKATQIFFSSHIMAFLSFGKMRSVLIQEKSNKLLFLKSIKLFLWEASFFL